MTLRRATILKAVPTVIAIPALNEELRLAASIRAIVAQRDLDGKPLRQDAVQVAILANNCTDDTVALARRLAGEVASNADAPRIHVRDIELPPERAHAGEARRAALDWADELLAAEPGGLLCTTDADSRVHPDWLAQTWVEHANGADAICGTVEFDEAEAGSLVWPEVRRLEARYSALQAELIAALDPEPHDPWPNHIWAWGASLAVTRRAYRESGGLPLVPLAEDRAFMERLRHRDFKVRHSLAVRVSTSCRVDGRAPGGLADLIAAYRDDLAYPCDAELLPAAVVAERARCRSALRAMFGAPASAASAERLGVDLDVLEQSLAEQHFGAAWRIIEHAKPACHGVRLWPADLPAEIERATATLNAIRSPRAAGRDDSARAATAGLWGSPAALPR